MMENITFTEEELGELESVLRHEVEATRLELRRTRNVDYRRKVENRLHRLEKLEEKVSDYLHAPTG